MTATSHRLEAYIGFFTTLTPESLTEIDRVFMEHARFRDPFNEAFGQVAIRHVFEHMFRVTMEPRFVVTDVMESGDAAFLRWEFTCRIRGRTLDLTGVSHVRFAADGRVVEHVDYWDPVAGLYDRLPVIGALLRWLRRRMAA